MVRTTSPDLACKQLEQDIHPKIKLKLVQSTQVTISKPIYLYVYNCIYPPAIQCYNQFLSLLDFTLKMELFFTHKVQYMLYHRCLDILTMNLTSLY